MLRRRRSPRFICHLLECESPFLELLIAELLSEPSIPALRSLAGTCKELRMPLLVNLFEHQLGAVRAHVDSHSVDCVHLRDRLTINEPVIHRAVAENVLDDDGAAQLRYACGVLHNRITTDIELIANIVRSMDFALRVFGLFKVVFALPSPRPVRLLNDLSPPSEEAVGCEHELAAALASWSAQGSPVYSLRSLAPREMAQMIERLSSIHDYVESVDKFLTDRVSHMEELHAIMAPLREYGFTCFQFSTVQRAAGSS